MHNVFVMSHWSIVVELADMDISAEKTP